MKHSFSFPPSAKSVIRKKKWLWILIAVLLLLFAMGLWIAFYFNLIPERIYYGEDFDIDRLISPTDYNQNGVDDYTDFLYGARKDAENHPEYDSRYWETGYPPDNIGVCADVIWRAFKEAGYSLRDMVDQDIARRPEAYFAVQTPDSNIDFRRVRNLRVFFDMYAESLTLNPEEIDQWQPGDIVIFGDNQHIGIVSDKRNRKGRVYLIHNGGQSNREEDYLKYTPLEISGHYRFNASQIDPSVLVPWTD